MSRSRRSRSSDRGQRDHLEPVWRRIDLHIHTPASADYQEPDCSFLDILRKAESRGADLIAFTDHNSVRGYANFWREIEDLELLEVLERLSPGEQRRLDDYRRLVQQIRILPGFELTATFGFHILAIFPEGTSIRQLEHLLLELNVPEDKIDLGSGEVGATTDVLRVYEVLHEAGALVIPAHVNSTHGVAMTNLPFGGQTKIAFTQSPYIHALEATDMESTSRRSTARFFNGSKPEYPRRMHIVQGSDAHRLNRDPNRPSNLGACDRMTEVQIEDVTFAGLKELFESDHFNRVRPYRPSHDPYDFVRMARAEGETIVQTFHDTLGPRRGRQSPVVRDAAAFANGNGGTIFVGLSANSREPVSGVGNAPEEARAIAEELARYVTPPIAGTIDIATTGDRQIIVVQVPAGSDKPYAVLPSMIYVRQEGETTLALRDEIVQLVKAGVAETSGALPELVPTAEPTPVVVQRRPAEVGAGVVAGESRERSSRSRRRRSGRVHVGEPLVADVSPAPAAEDVGDEATIEIAEQPAHEFHACEDIPFPRTGVEIVESVEREGVRYHAMRDLRNLKIVQNVTRDSARRLWRYAITQLELHPCRAEDVAWDADGDRGYWKSYKPRGGDVRYNLVYRHNGHLHVFYGVTDEGIDDAWRNVLPAHLAERQAAEPLLSDAPAADPGPVDEQIAAEPAEAATAEPVVESVPEPRRLVFRPLVEEPAPVEAQPEPRPEPEQEVTPEPPKRPRRTRTRKVAEPAVEAAAPTEAQPVPEPEVAPEPPKRPRRTRARKAAEPEATTEAAAEPTPAVEPTAPKPRRTRATRSRAKEQAAETAPEATAAEPEPAAEEAPKPKRTRRAATPRKAGGDSPSAAPPEGAT